MKRIERLRQWTGERFGALVGPGSESDLADDDIQLRKAGVERLHAATTVYTTQLSKRKKISSIDASQKLFPVDALGRAASMYSDDYDNEGAGAFPRALSLFGQTHQEVAEEIGCYSTDLVANVTSQLDQSLNTIAQYNEKKKKLESKRSAFEALTTKMQKSKNENHKLEDELRQVQETYEEAAEEVKQLAISVREDEPVQFESLTYFLNAELEFVHKYLTLLQTLKSQWPSSYSSSMGPKISQNPTDENNTSPRSKSGMGSGRFRSSSLGSRKPSGNSSPMNSRKPSRATSPISEAPPPPEQETLESNSLSTSAAMMSLKELSTRKRSNTQGSARSNTSTPTSSDKGTSIGGTVASTTAKVRSRASSIPLPRPSMSRIGSFIKMGGSSSGQGRSAYDQLLPSGQNNGNSPDIVHERASEDSYDQGATGTGNFMMGGSMAGENSSDDDIKDLYHRTPLSEQTSPSQSPRLKAVAATASVRRPPPPVPPSRKRSDTAATHQPPPTEPLASPFDDPT